MGLFWWMSYGNLESLRCTTEGEEAARRNSMNNAMTSFDIKYLKRVAKGTRFSDVRYAAESRISELKSLSRKQRKEKEQEYKDKEEEKKKLAEQFNKAAEEKDSPEYWLKKLYGNYVTENSYGRELIEKGLLAYGDGMYPNVRAYVFSLARAFHEFTGGIREIRYGTDEGRRTGAVIDKHSESLEKAICFLAKFNHPDRAAAIRMFYQYIKENVYSDPESGFGDMFNAVNIRKEAVWAMGQAAKEDHQRAADFYVEALRDPSRFVRWQVIDNLKDQWTPEEIKSNPALYEELDKAYAKEDNSISNRKAKCRYLLGKET